MHVGLLSLLEPERSSMARAAASWALVRLGAQTRCASSPDGLMHAFELGAARPGVPILWLHGAWGDSEAVAIYAASFAEQRRSLVPDLFGLAPRSRRFVRLEPAVPFGPKRHARALAGWLAALRVPEVDVVGVELGAWIGLWLAATTDLVRKAVFVSPIGARTPSDEAASAGRPFHRETFEALGSRGMTKAVVQALGGALAMEGERDVLGRPAVGSTEEDWIDSALPTVRAPIFMFASDGEDLDAYTAKRIIDGVAGARGAWVDGSARALFYRNPGVVGAAVQRELGIEDAATASPVARRVLSTSDAHATTPIRRRRASPQGVPSVRAPTKNER